MGTLSEGLMMDMLRDFQLAVLDRQMRYEEDLQARMGRPPVWRWAPGTFVFPEGLCCYCGGVMRSPAIWRAENLQFHGSWKVVQDGDGTGHFAFDLTHPHVNAGSICMGGDDNYRATSVADALFLAFNPLSSYFGAIDDPNTGEIVASTNQRIKAWFADRFDHRCGEQAEVQTAEGIDIRHVVAPEEGCHCGHCRRHRGEVLCRRESCGEWFNPNTGHGRFRCPTCDPGNRRHYCVKHKHEVHRCIDCMDSHDLYSDELGQLDPDPQIKQCGECKQWVCIYCLGEAEDSSPEHSCALRDGLAEKDVGDGDCDHHCADCCAENECDVCDFCGCYPSDCSC